MTTGEPGPQQAPAGREYACAIVVFVHAPSLGVAQQKLDALVRASFKIMAIEPMDTSAEAEPGWPGQAADQCGAGEIEIDWAYVLDEDAPFRGGGVRPGE